MSAELYHRFETLFQERDLLFLGTCSPEVGKDFARYTQWLERGKHAGLKFLERHLNLRENPELLLEGAKSVIVFGLPYFHESSTKAALYAQFRDYHKLLRREGKRIIQKLAEEFQWKDLRFRVLVDSAPVLERALAVQAGKGFVGKNTLFIHPERGSFLLLAEILINQEIPFSKPEAVPNCGSCTLCQVACPTEALNEDYVLDANRCLAFWTIEQPGNIPEEFHPHLKDSFFGCDICQTVCPYNQAARQNTLPGWIEKLSLPSLSELRNMSEEEYQTHFAGTPFTRAKREGLLRNIRIALEG